MSTRHENLKQSLKVRPNTGLPQSFMQENIVMCCGEDPLELEEALRSALPGRRPRKHSYRCYHAWKYADFTVVLSGIGTGCLEPLLYELLNSSVENVGKRPMRLILIGTAGYLADSGYGKVFLAISAYPVGCGLSLADVELPLYCRFDNVELLSLPRAETISTDYYYACTPAVDDIKKVLAKKFDQELAMGIEKYWQPRRLIEMETAQFYHFCRIYGDDTTQFVALRGVANLADQFESQGDYSQQVLTTAFQHAVSLLEVQGKNVTGLRCKSAVMQRASLLLRKTRRIVVQSKHFRLNLSCKPYSNNRLPPHSSRLLRSGVK